jgi:hypothetical protein
MGHQAERKCETMIRKITGPVFHRPDIGTAAVLDKRVAHMQQVGSLIPKHSTLNILARYIDEVGLLAFLYYSLAERSL